MLEKLEKTNRFEKFRPHKFETPGKDFEVKKDLEEIKKTVEEINSIESFELKNKENLDTEQFRIEQASELYYLDSVDNQSVDKLIETLKFDPKNYKAISKAVKKINKKANSFEKEKVLEFIYSFN